MEAFIDVAEIDAEALIKIDIPLGGYLGAVPGSGVFVDEVFERRDTRRLIEPGVFLDEGSRLGEAPVAGFILHPHVEDMETCVDIAEVSGEVQIQFRAGADVDLFAQAAPGIGVDEVLYLDDVRSAFRDLCLDRWPGDQDQGKRQDRCRECRISHFSFPICFAGRKSWLSRATGWIFRAFRCAPSDGQGGR